MTRTTCEELADKIVDYVDGELPPPEAQSVDRHLAECDCCRQTAEALRRSLDLAKVLWSDNLAEPVAAAPAGHGRILPRWSFYPLAAAAGILLAVGLLVLPSHQGPQSHAIRAEHVERQVARAGLAAELFAATQMLAQCEGTETIVEHQYQYILREYTDTPVAKTIRAGLGSGGI